MDGADQSLRVAILSANNDSGTATDTIQLAAGTYTLTIANTADNHDVSGTQGDLNITSTSHALIIQGATDANGKPTTVIDQTAADRVFQIVNAGTTVTFRDVVIEGGDAREDGGAGTAAGSTDAQGGGILDDGGNVTLTNVVLQNNTAEALSSHDASGGGIYVYNGSLTITNSVIQNNDAFGGNGNGTVSYGGSGLGGGVCFKINLPQQLKITASTVAGNIAEGGNGYSASNGNGGYAYGGGLYAGNGSASSVFITASTVSGNSATGGDGGGTGNAGSADGGGVWIDGVSQFVNSTVAENNAIAGKGASPFSDGGGMALSMGTATLTNVTVAGNTASLAQGGSGTTNGGGIDIGLTDVTLTNTLAALNSAGAGPDVHGTVTSSSDHNLIGNADGSSGFSAAPRRPAGHHRQPP